MFRKISLLALVAVLLFSCGGHQARQQENGDTLQLKYSSLLTIVRHDGYTVVDIRNPWREHQLLHSYILVPRDGHTPDNLPHGTIIHTPLQRTAVFTTVHCALLTEIGHQDDIVAVADLKYIKIPSIHDRVAKGIVADCGGGLNPVVEKIMDVHPEAIMLSPFENSGGYGKVEEIGIPIIECAEYMEPSPLARAEWMKFYGMLFDEYHKTDSLFAVVDSSYHALKNLAGRQTTHDTTVLLDKIAGSVWYVPGGRSTIGQMIADAGAQYPWADDEHAGSLALPFETVLEHGGEADLWLFRYSADHDITLAELLTEHRGYSQLRPFRNQQVYGCNVEQTLFYEESPFHPDFLLNDFIQIFHPEMTNLQPLRYYKKLIEAK